MNMALAVKPVDSIPTVEEVGGYVTVEYAARRLGATRSWVSLLLLSGKVKGVQLDGRTRLVERRSLERYAKRREGQGGAP